MKTIKTTNGTTPIPRSGFTLIELLTVITIISILLALILPAITNVFFSAQVTAVSAEFTQLDQALASFKAKFGDYPPSNLVIPADDGDPSTDNGWDARSRAAVQAIWPQFDFNTNGGLPNTAPIHLNGAECLVFFLGGVEGGSVGAATLHGFSKNPLTPWTLSENPDGPFMEFDFSRLTDVDGPDYGGAPPVYEYLDPLPDQTAPILYLSAAGGRYDKANSPSATAMEYPNDAYDVLPFGSAANNLQNVYTQSDGNTPWKSDTFQLISPGDDGLYGAGGPFNVDEELPSNRRVQESNNITNFSGGTLE